MSDAPKSGEPVDILDGICKKYRQCLNCAQKEHGANCIPEYFDNPKGSYKTKKKNGEIICKDDAGTCERKFLELG